MNVMQVINAELVTVDLVIMNTKSISPIYEL